MVKPIRDEPDIDFLEQELVRLEGTENKGAAAKILIIRDMVSAAKNLDGDPLESNHFDHLCLSAGKLLGKRPSED